MTQGQQKLWELAMWKSAGRAFLARGSKVKGREVRICVQCLRGSVAGYSGWRAIDVIRIRG